MFPSSLENALRSRYGAAYDNAVRYEQALQRRPGGITAERMAQLRVAQRCRFCRRGFEGGESMRHSGPYAYHGQCLWPGRIEQRAHRLTARSPGALAARTRARRQLDALKRGR